MKHVAYISEGSVSQGVIAYLSEDENIERFSIGSMMKIEGNMRSYLAMIVDAGIKARYHLSMISREVPEEFKEVLISKFSSELRMPWIKLALIAQRDFKGGEASVADSMPSFYSKVYDLKRKDAKLFFSEENKTGCKQRQTKRHTVSANHDCTLVSTIKNIYKSICDIFYHCFGVLGIKSNILDFIFN